MEEIYVKTKVLYEALDIPEENRAIITRLKNKGVITPSGHGEWPLIATVNAFIRHTKASKGRNQYTGEDSEDKRSLEREQLIEKIKKDALQNAKTVGTLIESKQILPFIKESAGIVYKLLEQIPLEFKREYPAATPEMISGLDRLIKRTQNAALVKLPDELRKIDERRRSDKQDS